MDHIQIRGARTHNLKNIDLDMPRDRLIVVTGLSGSESRPWRLIHSMPRASGDTLSHCRLTQGSSCR